MFEFYRQLLEVLTQRTMDGARADDEGQGIYIGGGTLLVIIIILLIIFLR